MKKSNSKEHNLFKVIFRKFVGKINIKSELNEIMWNKLLLQGTSTLTH